MLIGLTRLRGGRIWALARLSLKEAVRSRVVLVFGFMILIFLFAGWFVPYRAEDQVRNYVRVVYWPMGFLFLVTAGLLGSLSIPADIKSQSIHTIVTKPVEKFEIVLGRFLGYGLLLTAGLAVVAILSLGYVVRGVDNAAAQESFKARVPIFGKLSFIGTQRPMGDSVGREDGYRGYIAGPHIGAKNAPKQYAVWELDSVPAALAQREETVTIEFTFDIFRLSKGDENKDIPCTFTFADGNLTLPEVDAGLAKILAEREKQTGPRDFASELIEQYGIHTAPGTLVTDYHTQDIKVPVAFFKKVLAADHPAGTPQMRVFVSVDLVDSGAQMLGVARRDLYVLADEKLFWPNFLKGVAGMWCAHMLVLGIAVALSTYLSGMIAWPATMFLYGFGMFTEYLQKLAENRMEGGGPGGGLFTRDHRQGHGRGAGTGPGHQRAARCRRGLQLGAQTPAQPDSRRQPIRPVHLRGQRLRHSGLERADHRQPDPPDRLLAALGHPGVLPDEISRDRQSNMTGASWPIPSSSGPGSARSSTWS